MPRPVPSNGKSLRVREVAADLNVSPNTVYRLIDADELLGIRVGRSIRIPAVAYEKYCREKGLI